MFLTKEKNKLLENIENTKDALKDFISLIFYILIAILIFMFMLLIIINFNPKIFLSIINEYIKIIISYWSGTILVLGLVLFTTQKNSIAEFISKRLISIGPDGVKGSPNQNTILEIQNDTEEENSINTTKETDYQKLYILEKIYNVIFGSQITLLEDLRLCGELGLSYLDIGSYFEKVKLEHWNNITDKWSLEKYLSYPINENLIEKVGGENLRYKISPFGIEFLSYIEENNYSKIKVL